MPIAGTIAGHSKSFVTPAAIARQHEKVVEQVGHLVVLALDEVRDLHQVFIG